MLSDGNPEDSSLFTFAYVSSSSTNGALHKRTGLNVWNWIASKIRSTFGFNSSNVLTVANGGTGLADGVTLLYSVTEVPGYANRTSTSSLKGFTVFDVVSHAI